LWPALLLAFLISPGTAIASEDEKANCQKSSDNAELCDDYLQKVHDDKSKSALSSVQQKPEEKFCYCDVRKQKQVEIRLRNQEGRLPGKTRFSSERYSAAD
jgi:hypothetical protein